MRKRYRELKLDIYKKLIKTQYLSFNHLINSISCVRVFFYFKMHNLFSRQHIILHKLLINETQSKFKDNYL